MPTSTKLWNCKALGRAYDLQTMPFQQSPQLKPTSKIIKKRNECSVVYLLSSDWSDLKSVRRLPSLIVPPSWPGWCSGISIIYAVTTLGYHCRQSLHYTIALYTKLDSECNKQAMVVSQLLTTLGHIHTPLPSFVNKRPTKVASSWHSMTVGVPWRNFLGPEFGGKSQREILWSYPNFCITQSRIG